MIDNDPPKPHEQHHEQPQPVPGALTEPTEACDAVDGLSPVKAKAIIALLNEPSILKAAHAAGVGERTLHKWLDTDEEFIAAYRQARRQTFTQAIGLTMRYTPIAVNTLVKVMVDTKAPYASRVAAATSLLRFGRESVELDDLASRVDSLERLQNVPAPRLVMHRAISGGGAAGA